MEKIIVDGDSDKDIAKIDELTTKICQIIADSDCDARVKVQSCCNAMAFVFGTDAELRQSPQLAAKAFLETVRLIKMYNEYHNQQN